MNTLQRLIIVLLVSFVFVPVITSTTEVKAFDFGGSNCTDITYSWRLQQSLFLQNNYALSEWNDAEVLIIKPYFDNSFPSTLAEENYYLSAQAITNNHYSRMNSVGGSLSVSATAGASAGISIFGFPIIEGSGGITTTIDISGSYSWGYSTDMGSSSKYTKFGNSNSDVGGVVSANDVWSKFYANEYREYKLVTDPVDGTICIGPGQSGYTDNYKYELTEHHIYSWTQDADITFTHIYQQSGILDPQTASLLDGAIANAKLGASVDTFNKFVPDGVTVPVSGTYLKNGIVGTVGNDVFSHRYFASKTEHKSWNFKFELTVTNNDAFGLFGGKVEVKIGASAFYQYSSQTDTTNTLELEWGVTNTGDGLPPTHAYQGKVFTFGPGIGAFFSNYG